MSILIDRITGKPTRWEGLAGRVSVSSGSGPMQAVILAAGGGARLGKASEGLSKCLLPFDGKPLIAHLIDTLAGEGISDVTVVIGYGGAAIRAALGGRVRYVVNDDWQRTHSLYSLSLCRDRITKPVLVINGDVLMHPEIIRRVASCPDNGFAYDCRAESSDWIEISEPVTGDEADLPPMVNGASVGIFRFEVTVMQDLFDLSEDIIKAGGRRAWMTAAMEIIAQSVSVWGIDVSDLPWIEIDVVADLDRACDDIWPRIKASV